MTCDENALCIAQVTSSRHETDPLETRPTPVGALTARLHLSPLPSQNEAPRLHLSPQCSHSHERGQVPAFNSGRPLAGLWQASGRPLAGLVGGPAETEQKQEKEKKKKKRELAYPFFMP